MPGHAPSSSPRRAPGSMTAMRPRRMTAASGPAALMAPGPGSPAARRKAALATISPPLPEGMAKLGPLVQAAHGLLLLAPRLRRLEEIGDPEALRRQLEAELRPLQGAGRRHGQAAQALVDDAHDALCALLDEAVGATPRAAASTWRTGGLAAILHGDLSEGERSLQLLGKARAIPCRCGRCSSFSTCASPWASRDGFATPPGRRIGAHQSAHRSRRQARQPRPIPCRRSLAGLALRAAATPQQRAALGRGGGRADLAHARLSGIRPAGGRLCRAHRAGHRAARAALGPRLSRHASDPG